MFSRIRRLPSPALVISAIALIVAVGGGTFAIAGSENAKDKKIAKKVANKRITKRAPGLSVGHAGSADNATNADHANSADSATNATNATNAGIATVGTSPLAWAHVDASGNVLAGRGVTSANFHKISNHYCFNGLPFQYQSAQVTIDAATSDYASDVAQVNVTDQSATDTRCTGVSAPQGYVNVINANGDLPDTSGFYIAFFN